MERVRDVMSGEPIVVDAATPIRRAAEIMHEAEGVMESHGSDHLVVVASPQMLHLLRAHTEPLRHHGLAVDETALDLTHETVPQLEQHLTRAGLLPPHPATH